MTSHTTKMNKQHEKLENLGVRSYIAKKFDKPKGSKMFKKWQKEEKAEQKREAKYE